MGGIITDFVIPNVNLAGIYNLSSDPISKCDLLNLVKYVYKKQIAIEAFDGFAVNRSLNSERFQQATGYKAPPWEKMIKDMYANFMNDNCYFNNSYRKAKG